MSNNSIIKEQTPETIRALGGVLIFIGAILVGGIGALMIWINNLMTSPSSTIKFAENSPQNQILFPVLGMVAIFGLTAMIAGTWQVVTGKRNKALIWLMLGLGIVLFILAKVIPNIL